MVGHRQAKRHDQGAALQLIVEQRASRDGHAHAGDGSLDGQVVAVEGVPAPHVGLVVANGVQVKLPLGVFITATPGGDVVQQREMHQVSRAMQGRTAAQQAGRAYRENLLIEQSCG